MSGCLVIESIVIPVLNGYDLLERCVASIPEPARRILIIDNGDELAANGFYDSPHDVRVVSSSTNLGVATSWNLGIKMEAFATGWLLLNHDAWFDPGAFYAFENDCAEDRITLAGSPPWCCAWIGRGVVSRVGLFCEAFHPAYMEDVDYQRRADVRGVPVVLSGAVVHHDNSSTIRSSGKYQRMNDESHAANNRVYQERWGSVGLGCVPSVLEWSLATRLAQSWDS